MKEFREIMTLICVTLVEKTIPEIFSSAEECSTIGADLIELRLDRLEDTLSLSTLDKLFKLKEKTDLGVIFTLRPSWEGGNFKKYEERRLDILENAIDIGFDYVDLELKIEDSRRDALITKAKENGVRTIMSSHDFERTPDWKKIVALINKCKNIGDHIKLVFHNTSYVDSMNILKAGKAALAQNFKFSVMGMGPFGHITRILAPTIGSEFACASLKQDKEAVEGQVDIKTLLEMWEILEFV